MALCRAIQRSSTGVFYSYPFTLADPAPAVMIQLPLVIIANLGRLMGLPLAFELARVLGSAASGAALAAIGQLLFPASALRRWFWVAAALGGGWFTFGAIEKALEVAGVDGLTDVPPYFRQVFGEHYFWMPFLLQNLVYPLECVYHGLVLGALALLLAGRWRWALVVGGITWFSNPFPGAGLSAAVLVWLMAQALGARSHRLRVHARCHFGGWLLLTVIAVGYYRVFLLQWPVLRELSRLYEFDVARPYNALKTFLLLGPWAGFILAGALLQWRRLLRPRALLFLSLFVTQIILVWQGTVMGERAVQPHHFNRGYLHLSVVALAWLGVSALVKRGWHRVVPVAIVVTLSTVPDQALFFWKFGWGFGRSGEVLKSYQEVVVLTRKYPPGSLVYVQTGFESPLAAYLPAATHNVPYEMTSTLVVPYAQARRERMTHALAAETSEALNQLGLRAAIISRDQPDAGLLKKHGWHTVAERGDYLLMEPPF